MGSRTKIPWTDATWNPVTGCTKVSPGCTNCYAERMAHRFGGAPFVNGQAQILFHEDRLTQPIRWRRPRRIFVCSMGDLFHEDVPDSDLLNVWVTMAMAREHTFQVLTKRPERMREFVTGLQNLPGGHKLFSDDMWPLRNVWLGVSVEDQRRADERIPVLLDTPAKVRFVSCEPLLGWLTLNDYLYETAAPGCCVNIDGEWWHTPGSCRLCKPALDWVIVGGESGPGARPMEEDWVRAIRDHCQRAHVPLFYKQKAAKAPGRLEQMPELDGKVWAEFP